MSLLEAISPTARTLLASTVADHKAHLARVRELQRRLDAAQTADAEEAILKLMEAENTRWQTAQQQPTK